jgi:hypothetical protein
MSDVKPSTGGTLQRVSAKSRGPQRFEIATVRRIDQRLALEPANGILGDSEQPRGLDERLARTTRATSLAPVAGSDR